MSADRKPHVLHASLGDKGCLFEWRIECPYEDGDWVSCRNPAYEGCLVPDWLGELGGELLDGFEQRVPISGAEPDAPSWKRTRNVGLLDPHFPLLVDVIGRGEDGPVLVPWAAS